MLFDVGWRGLFRCGEFDDQCCHHPASDVMSIHSQVLELRQRAQCSRIEGLLMELIGGAVRFLLSLHAEAGIYSGAGR